MPRNDIKTGQFTAEAAANLAKELLDRNQFLNTDYKADLSPLSEGGIQPDEIAKMIAYVPTYESQFDEFQGEFLLNGNGIGETYLASHHPLNEVERFDNADPKNMMVENWAPTAWTYKPKDYILKNGKKVPRAKYFKYSFDSTMFRNMIGGARTKEFFISQTVRQQTEDVKKYRDSLTVEALGEFINRGLKVFDSSDKETFDPSKEYHSLTQIDANTTQRTYVKDSEGNVYAILELIKPNQFQTLEEAEKEGYAGKLRFVSEIVKPGTGADEDEVIKNCKDFIKSCDLLAEDLKFARLGRSFFGNETGNGPIDRVLFLKKGIYPELKNELIRNTFRGDTVLPWRVKIVDNFGGEVPDDVYGFLMDSTAFRVHQSDWETGVDKPVMAETRTYQVIIHTDYRQWISGFRQVIIFREPKQLRKLKTKNK